MKQNLYQSLINRLRTKHTKLATRFVHGMKAGSFQKLHSRKRKQAVEQLKKVERQLERFGITHSQESKINYRHWALGLALGVIITTASAQESPKKGLINKLKARATVSLQTKGNSRAMAQTISFTKSFQLGAAYAQDIHLGDLDGDGDTDVIYVPYIGVPVILLNDGASNFTEASPTILNPDIIFQSALGDFDGDGDLDLLTQSGEYGMSQTTQVWVNDGTAGFTAQAATFPAVDIPNLTASDIDGDGDEDIISAGNYGIGVFLNTSFNFVAAPGAPLNGPYDTQSQFLTLIDIDGDTDLDIAYNGVDGSFNQGVRFFTNNGTGTFADASTHIMTGSSNRSASVGDLDNDGDSDLVVTYGASGYEVVPMLNDGTGNFTAQATVVVAGAEDFNDIFSEDFNGDNFDDFALSTEEETFIYQGDGLGGFTAQGSFVGSVRPGSLDGDGDIDFIVFDKDLSWVENQGAFAFMRSASDILLTTSSYDIDVVDIDGDGDLDIIPGGDKSSRVWSNDGTGQSFTITQNMGQDAQLQVFGDLDGDGDADMIKIAKIPNVNNQGFEIWINNAGTLSLDNTIGGTVFRTRYAVLADLDGDSDLDIVALTVIEGMSQYDIKTFLNQGSLTFAEQSSITFAAGQSPEKISLGNIDGDSDIDVLVANEGYGMEVFVNDGAGNLTFDSNVVPLGSTFEITGVEMGDLDGDGDLDVFASNGNGSADSYVFINDGTGAFTDNGQNVPVGIGLYQSSLGDLDGDGDLDLITGGYISRPKVWVNDGAGNFSFDSDVDTIADEYTQIAFGDLDGDGDLDFAIGGAYSPSLVFLNDTGLPPDLLAADSTVLVSVYDNMGGTSWNDATNWKTGDVSTWFGITVTGDRVTDIELPNNNVQGTIPATINQLDALEVLDLSMNEIDEIATDFSGLTSIQTLNLSDNNLDFDDLAGIAGVNGVVYDAQTPDDIEVDELLAVHSSITFGFIIPGVANTYQWYRDGDLLVDSTRNEIVIQDLIRSNMGEYFCLVENTNVPGLTISSARKNVLAQAVVNGKLLIDNDGTPATAGQVTLLEVTNSDGYDTTAVFDVVGNGEYVFNDVILSDYLIVGFPDTVQHAGSLPTYYNKTVFWAEADTVFLFDNLMADIVAISQNNPSGGVGSFAGTLDEDDGLGGRLLGRRRVGGAGVTARRGHRAGRIFGTGDLAYYVFTDNDGNFLIPGMEPGEYNIEILYPGYPMDEDSYLDMTIGSDKNDKDIIVEALVDKGLITVNQIILTKVDDFDKTTVKAYPNPASDLLNIQWEEQTERVEVQVFNSQGKQVITKQLTKNENRLSTERLPKGQYLLILLTDQKVIGKYKMTIMR